MLISSDSSKSEYASSLSGSEDDFGDVLFFLFDDEDDAEILNSTLEAFISTSVSLILLEIGPGLGTRGWVGYLDCGRSYSVDVAKKK
ncbi:3493_t:CDS:2 [Ambispora gerdemannii]|uniref:3493_t:CDS:1 n=1 Tax=Ambispora gerdemannii TaxID=144530 RepID=A0A9N9B434_9GLOM|nr:3493_t:CDS:2 [Ambispora gerdemannii]